ncbi:unnamed protein product [Ilex paraguariensis]|uniref:Uncharacterized protein n=1 Tax=Ilex paraguariensis TaxID=185542 RepID=A0ABC8UUT2_9AQUA
MPRAVVPWRSSPPSSKDYITIDVEEAIPELPLYHRRPGIAGGNSCDSGVNVEIDDGRITAVHPIEMLQSLNETRVDFTILASSTPPIASVPQILAPLTEMASQLIGVTD